MIWNNRHKVLLSSSADGSCKIIKVSGKELVELNKIKIPSDTPTSIEWIGDTAFVTGLVSSNKLFVYDIQTNKKAW